MFEFRWQRGVQILARACTHPTTTCSHPLGQPAPSPQGVGRAATPEPQTHTHMARATHRVLVSEVHVLDLGLGVTVAGRGGRRGARPR
eukprot:195118-Chlamydomonas_euryale.AAC.2